MSRWTSSRSWRRWRARFIDAARGLEAGRETALQNRIEAYRHISKKAHWAANELQSTKSDLVEIVNSAEEKIQTSRENAEKAKAVAAQTSPLTAAGGDCCDRGSA